MTTKITPPTAQSSSGSGSSSLSAAHLRTGSCVSVTCISFVYIILYICVCKANSNSIKSAMLSVMTSFYTSSSSSSSSLSSSYICCLRFTFTPCMRFMCCARDTPIHVWISICTNGWACMCEYIQRHEKTINEGKMKQRTTTTPAKQRRRTDRNATSRQKLIT